MAVKKKKKNGSPSVEEPIRKLHPRKYLVQLKHNDPRVVVAKTEEGAWNKYKKMMGIRFTEHEPKIRRAPEDMEYDEETGKVLKAGVVTPEEEEDDADFDTSEDEDDDE